MKDNLSNSKLLNFILICGTTYNSETLWLMTSCRLNELAIIILILFYFILNSNLFIYFYLFIYLFWLG